MVVHYERLAKDSERTAEDSETTAGEQRKTVKGQQKDRVKDSPNQCPAWLNPQVVISGATTCQTSALGRVE